MKIKIILAVIFILILILIFKDPFFNDNKQRKVCFKDKCFNVELAITPQEKAHGLMFRDHLNENEGMIFVYDKEGDYSFWMKNVLIPLDIIWINEEKNVVFISYNTQPCGQFTCNAISASEKAKYVLEINGGVSEEIGLKVKDTISLDF